MGGKLGGGGAGAVGRCWGGGGLDRWWGGGVVRAL